MNNTIVAYGICADNNDPWGVGRIRVIIDQDIQPPIRTGLNIQDYIANLDAINVSNDGTHAYIPWELGAGGHSPDPYVIEPFLPKHLNIIPKIGESVKVLYYTAGDPTSQREYVAPQTSNYDKLNFDTIETARSFTKRTTYHPTQNNLRSDGLVSDPNDIGLMGRKNSEMILPDNEVILRAGHQNFADKIKNNRNALIQASFFPQRKTVNTETVTEDTSPTKQINYLVDLLTVAGDKSVDPLYIVTDIRVYPVENVDTKNYNDYVDYFADVQIAEFHVQIKSDKADSIISFVNTFLKNLDKNNMALTILGDWTFTPEKNPNLAYWSEDNRASENTEVNFYPLNLYQVRLSPQNDYTVPEVRAVSQGVTSELRPLSKRPSRQSKQVKKDVTTNDPSFNETVAIMGADKVFLLSWFNSKSIQNRMSKYGFTQDEIYLTLQNNTEPMVKGTSLINLLLDMLELFANHGHSTGVDPIGSLNKGATSKISEIKDRYALTTPVTKNLGGGSTILNQYLRLD